MTTTVAIRTKAQAKQETLRLTDGTRVQFSPDKFRELFEQSGMLPKEFRRKFFGDSEQWKAGVNNRYFKQWLNGHVAPKYTTTLVFAEILNCHFTDLYEEI